MSKVGGFTLIEALVVVGISVILVSTSLHTFLDTIERYQIRTQADRFLSIIKLARVTAIENVKRVRICPSTNQSSCDTSGGFNWSNGFIVLVDSNDNSTYSLVSQVIGSMEGNSTITLKDGSAATISSLTFRPLGILDGVTSATFEFRMPGCSGPTNRDISIAFNGSASISTLECPE